MYLNLIQSTYRFEGALCALKSYFEIIVFATEISTPALNTTINDSDEADDRNQVEPAPENEKYLETDSNCVSEANVDHLIVDDLVHSGSLPLHRHDPLLQARLHHFRIHLQ